MSNSSKIINTIFILFFVMSSFYSSNLRKSHKTLGSPNFDIFNIGKLANDVDGQNKKFDELSSEENVKKSLKEEFFKVEHEENNLKDLINQKPNTPVKPLKPVKPVKPAKPVKNTDDDTSMREDKYILTNLMRNHTNPSGKDKRMKRKFYKNILNFLQKELYPTEEIQLDNVNHSKLNPKILKIKNLMYPKKNMTNPEILKIKNLMYPKKNMTNPEILKIKNRLNPKANNKNFEIEKIKSIINPGKKVVEKNNKVNKTEATQTIALKKTEATQTIALNKTKHKKSPIEKLEKEDVEKKEKKYVEEKKVEEKKIKEKVLKNEIEKKVLKNEIEKKVNKTENKEKVQKNEIKKKLKKTENKEKVYKNEIEKKVNKTEIKELIVNEEIKDKSQSKFEEKVESKIIPAEIRKEDSVNNQLKEFAAKSLKYASERLEKEISAELQKESAEDTKEQVMALFKLKIEKYAEDFQKAANELKAEISADLLNEADNKEILEKARAVKILENAGKASIVEKEQTARTLKKIVFLMMKEKYNIENDYSKKILAKAFDKIVDLKKQEIEKNNAEEKLMQAINVDAEEKERTFESLREAKGETNIAIEEIEEERKAIKVESKIEAEVMKKIELKKEAKKKNLRKQ